ncbi:MAG TPA: APC family permease [Paraburkholderia sp.]
MNTRNEPRLRGGAIGVPGIVFFVIATNGPLIGLIGAVPVALTLGNGIGVSGTFLLAGLTYLIFSVGFAAMARYVKSAGAFYTYVTKGLGRPPGVSAAALAITSYVAIQLACYAMVGFFLGQFEQAHFDHALPWWINALLVCAIVLICGYRNIEFSGKLLGVLMLCEITIVLIFDASVVAHGGGPEGLTLTPFLPSHVFSNGLGAALVFTIGSYVGFETTAIYAEEAKNPARTIPLAMYLSVICIMSFFAISVWALIVAYGPSHVVSEAQRDPGNLWFSAATTFVSPLAADAMSVLMITSLFAALVSLQNAVARYFFSLGREGVLWKKLSAMHPIQRSPYIASLFQSAISCTIVVGFAATGASPMDTVLPVTSTFASIGLLVVQVMTSLAVIGFFRQKAHEEGPFQSLIAPMISTFALTALVWLIINNVTLLAGGNELAGRVIGWLVVAVAISGLLYAKWIQRQRPDRYAALGRVLSEM